MTFFGWLFITVSWTIIIVLTVFCFLRVLREKDEDM
jgi:hypothetical protein